MNTSVANGDKDTFIIQRVWWQLKKTSVNHQNTIRRWVAVLWGNVGVFFVRWLNVQVRARFWRLIVEIEINKMQASCLTRCHRTDETWIFYFHPICFPNCIIIWVLLGVSLCVACAQLADIWRQLLNASNFKNNNDYYNDTLSIFRSIRCFVSSQILTD